MIQTHRQSGAGVVLVDAGSFSGTRPSSGEARGLFLVEMMKELDYDAVTLGETEAGLGRDLLFALAADPELPLVSANLRDAETAERLLPASRLVTRNGVRVGITAVSMRDPQKLQDIGVVCADPVESLRDVLPELRAGSDLVVLLARMSLPAARELSMSLHERVDIIVVGNGVKGRGQISAEEGSSVYLESGNRGQALGIARVFFAGDGRPPRILGDEITLDRDVPFDPDTRDVVKEFLANLDQSLARESVLQAVENAADDGQYYLGADNCKTCHPREFELWKETPHSDAFGTLVLAKSESLPECYGCHVTGSREDAGYDPTAANADRLTDVQCEVCHGPGSGHARDGSYGQSRLMDSCVQCHNTENSPDFDPQIYWLMIEH